MMFVEVKIPRCQSRDTHGIPNGLNLKEVYFVTHEELNTTSSRTAGGRPGLARALLTATAVPSAYAKQTQFRYRYISTEIIL